MSKNIVIQEGGTGVQLTVDKLKTGLVGGGTCLWVPEDEVQLTTKSIDKNGTYRASTEGYYGYSEVTVRGVGTVTGTDGDGDDATVTTDGDGKIVTTKIPSSIQVTTPPTKTTYVDGQDIDYSGMVVTAYLNSGSVWGTVPSGSLTLPETKAKYEPGTSGSATSEYQGNIDQPIIFNSGDIKVERYYEEYEYFRIEYKFTSGGARAIGYAHGDKLTLYFVSGSPFGGGVYLNNKRWGSEQVDYRWIGNFVGGSRDIHNKPVYVDVNDVTQLRTIIDPGAPVYSTPPSNDDFYTLVYGNIIEGGGTMMVPVQWSRPGDGMVLEAGFAITVNPS